MVVIGGGAGSFSWALTLPILCVCQGKEIWSVCNELQEVKTRAQLLPFHPHDDFEN